VLSDVAYKLSGCGDRRMTISAHTDNAGSAIYNNSLSKARARSVVKFLAIQGIDVNRIRAVAFGESQPIESNNTAEGRAANRRVDLIVR